MFFRWISIALRNLWSNDKLNVIIIDCYYQPYVLRVDFIFINRKHKRCIKIFLIKNAYNKIREILEANNNGPIMRLFSLITEF